MKKYALLTIAILLTHSSPVLALDYQSVISYLYPQAVNGENYELRDDGSGTKISRWNTGVLGAKPTDQALSDAEVTAPYLAWLATHGGDPVATAKRIAKELLAANDEIARLKRAIVKLAVDEVNTLRSRDRDRSADVAAATSFADLKVRWAARAALSNRTYAQAETAIRNFIDGE